MRLPAHHPCYSLPSFQELYFCLYGGKFSEVSVLRRAQVKSKRDGEMNLQPMSLEASCPHLRRSFGSTCSPGVMCDLRRHMLPHEGLGSAPSSAPWGGGQPAETAVTSSCCRISSWSRRLYFGTNLPVAEGQPSDSAGCCSLVMFSSFSPPLSSLVSFTFSITIFFFPAI